MPSLIDEVLIGIVAADVAKLAEHIAVLERHLGLAPPYGTVPQYAQPAD